MDALLYYLALVTFVVVGVQSVRVVWGTGRIKKLRDMASPADDVLPTLSIIAAGRDEGERLEGALRSLLEQRYSGCEVIFVDDRSSDGTGEILGRLAKEYEQLRVVRVEKLPTRWLGKNHALHLGAQRARGEWLLFTDADVTMEASAVRRAVGYALAKKVDHVAVMPRAIMPTWWLKTFFVAFVTYFFLFTRPWRVHKARSRAAIGIGAFNLVRAEAYRQVGGHAVIALRPDDDVQLGRLLKRGGFRQVVLDGMEHLSVLWYPTLGALAQGLEKNQFAAVNYRPTLVVGTTVMLVLCDLWPFAALFLTKGAVWWFYLGAAAAHWWRSGRIAKLAGYRWHHAAGYPLAAVLFGYTQWRSMMVALGRGGITWRGTFYSLDTLKGKE